jgi:hypothetical protein
MAGEIDGQKIGERCALHLRGFPGEQRLDLLAERLDFERELLPCHQTSPRMTASSSAGSWRRYLFASVAPHRACF